MTDAKESRPRDMPTPVQFQAARLIARRAEQKLGPPPSPWVRHLLELDRQLNGAEGHERA